MLSRHRKDFPEMVENGDSKNIDEEGGVEEEDENALYKIVRWMMMMLRTVKGIERMWWGWLCKKQNGDNENVCNHDDDDDDDDDEDDKMLMKIME